MAKKIQVNAIDMDRAAVMAASDTLVNVYSKMVAWDSPGKKRTIKLSPLGRLTFDAPNQVERLRAEITKIPKPGEFKGGYKAPSDLCRYAVLAVSTVGLGNVERNRIANYRERYGLEPDGWLMPHEATQDDFIKYASLGDIVSDKGSTQSFVPCMRPQGDLAQLHRAAVAWAWSSAMPIPFPVITQYPDLLERYPYRYGYYRQRTFYAYEPGLEDRSLVTHIYAKVPEMEASETNEV